MILERFAAEGPAVGSVEPYHGDIMVWLDLPITSVFGQEALIQELQIEFGPIWEWR